MTHAPSNGRRWFKFGCLGAIVFAFVLVIATLGLSFYLLNGVTEVTRDCYCLDVVACMVIEHMRANADAWPTEWDALARDYERVAPRFSNAWSLEELKDRVDIDWKFDARTLTNLPIDSQPQLRVISLRNGGKHHWAGSEPNELILAYVRTGKSPLDVPEQH